MWWCRAGRSTHTRTVLELGLTHPRHVLRWGVEGAKLVVGEAERVKADITGHGAVKPSGLVHERQSGRLLGHQSNARALRDRVRLQHRRK